MSFYNTVAQYYDAENADKTDDIDFYTELAEECAGTILEIGCGSGRVVLPLAKAGYTVHGIDNNAAMLALAQARVDHAPDAYPALTLQAGNILNTAPPHNHYHLILLSYNMLMHFHDQPEQITLLQRLRRIIADEGLLVIDLPNAGEVFAQPNTDALTLERTFINPDNGHMVLQQAVTTLDRVTQLMRIVWLYDEVQGDGTLKRTVAPVVFRYFFPYEVQLLLKLAGFRVEQIYGDVDGSPFESGCPRMVILAAPAIEPDAI